MPTDVVTNITSPSTINNATAVVYCMPTGKFNKLNATFETSFSYSDLENKFTNRFDDINYYTIGTTTIVGG